MPTTQPQGGIQYDEQGRPYILQGTRRIYISPVAFGGAAPKDTTGIFRSRPQWNQNTGKMETPISWGNIITMLTAAGLTGGVANAALAGGPAAAAGGTAAGTAGGTGAATAGVLPSATGLATTSPWGLTAAAPAITSQGISQGIPLGGGGNGFLNTLKNVGKKVVGGGNGGGFNPFQQAALAALAGLPALLANKGPSAEEKALYDQARQMTELQRRRIEHQNPLFQAVTQLAMSRLPTASQQPLQGL